LKVKNDELWAKVDSAQPFKIGNLQPTSAVKNYYENVERALQILVDCQSYVKIRVKGLKPKRCELCRLHILSRMRDCAWLLQRLFRNAADLLLPLLLLLTAILVALVFVLRR